jgi:hypothetical protein
MNGDFEVEIKVQTIAESSVTRIRGKSLVMLQVNGGSVYDEALEL